MAIFELPAQLWTLLRDVVMVLRPCRFSAVIILAGFVLLFTDQGQELTARLPTEGLGMVAWFNLAVFLWALESWYWSRIILDATFGDDRDAPLDHPRAARIRKLINGTPRVLAISAYSIAVAACLFAGSRAYLMTAVLAVEGVAFYVLLVKRLTLIGAREPNPPEWKKRWFLGSAGGGQYSLRALPLFSRVFLAVSLLLALALTLWVWMDAVGFAWLLGGAAVPFVGFAMIVPVGSLAVYFARHGGRAYRPGANQTLDDAARGYPVVVPLLLLAVAWSIWPGVDNHAVRRLGPLTGQNHPDLAAFLESRRKDASAAVVSRPVIVATAGGGLRAAYWTATVLGRIQDQAPGFRDRLLGVSGVSGGSLGAAVFVTLLSRDKLPSKAADCTARDKGSAAGLAGAYECAGQAVLTQDFLGPTVAALLFPDLIQRFLPYAFLPDRAQALEQSWERAWGLAGFDASLWRDRGFHQLWEGNKRLPALFLNGTHVESGKRVITSHVRIVRDPFTDAHDFFDLAGYAIRPSTAAHNSARFTYVSPAGTLEKGTHLVDGGYFENFGAVTAVEVLRGVLRFAKQSGTEARPIVILISNDPRLRDVDLPLPPQDTPRAFVPKTLASEVLSPLNALLATRDARGLLAVAELRNDVKDAGGEYFQFRLCEVKTPAGKLARANPPLGWVLSDDAEVYMREQMTSDQCGNADQLRKLIAALAD